MTSAHSNSSDRDGRRSATGRAAIVVGAVVVVVGLTAGVAIAAERHGTHSTDRSALGIRASSPARSGVTTTTTTPVVPLTVRSVTPAASATDVGTGSAVTLSFSVVPAASSPDPTLSPAVPGTWARSGTTWTFYPESGFIPGTRETVTVPTTTIADEGARQVALTAAMTSSFTVGYGSELRLQELLADLHYIPLDFTTTATATTAATTGIAAEPTTATAVRTTAVPGTFRWAYSDIPASLASDWSQGKADLMTTGAVMAFEADHGLAVDGIAGPEVWGALVKAVAARQLDPRPYSYIEVTEGDPEMLTVWQDGNPDVYSSLANTGAAGAATQLGTFPVYLRYADHSMVGTNPDGTKYDDPNIYWIAYFNGGDAIHGYPRASYGYPQSNGCVELPIANASVVWNTGDDWYGTLVNIS